MNCKFLNGCAPIMAFPAGLVNTFSLAIVAPLVCVSITSAINTALAALAKASPDALPTSISPSI